MNTSSKTFNYVDTPQSGILIAIPKYDSVFCGKKVIARLYITHNVSPLDYSVNAGDTRFVIYIQKFCLNWCYSG